MNTTIRPKQLQPQTATKTYDFAAVSRGLVGQGDDALVLLQKAMNKPDAKGAYDNKISQQEYDQFISVLNASGPCSKMPDRVVDTDEVKWVAGFFLADVQKKRTDARAPYEQAIRDHCDAVTLSARMGDDGFGGGQVVYDQNFINEQSRLADVASAQADKDIALAKRVLAAL